MADIEVIPSPAVVGIDPGKKCGLVRFELNALVLVMTVKDPGIREAIELLELHGKDAVMVLEEQFTPRGKPGSKESRVNPKSLKTLFRRRFTWQLAAQYLDLPCVVVYPATWQAAMLRGIPKDPNAKTGKDTKRRSVLSAMSLWPEREWTEDTADAVNMARWYRGLQDMDRRLL